MPVPSSMAGLSTTDALNSPAGADPIGTGLDNYLRAIQSIIRTTNAKGADIASAATTDIGAATGEFVTVTGSTTITSLGTVDAGIVRTVHFSGAPLLTYNATSLILPGNKNYQVAAGDVLQFRSLGSGNWRCVGISNPANAGAVTYVDTVADMTALTGPVDGALIIPAGRDAPGDVRMPRFRYSSSGATENFGTIFTQDSGGGSFHADKDGHDNVKWFAAKGDGSTIDTTAFTNAAAANPGSVVFCPKVSTSYVVNADVVNASTVFIFEGGRSNLTGTATAAQLRAIFLDETTELASGIYNGGQPIADDLRTGKIEIVCGTIRQQTKQTVTITAVGTTATVTHVNHGYTTGDFIVVSDVTETEYNGYFAITVTGTDTYTYTMTGSPASPATGTPRARKPAKWDYILDSAHTPIGMDTSAGAITASSATLTLPYLKTYSKVLAIVVGADETLANALNLTVGPSVGLSNFQLKMSVNLTLAAHVWWDGAAWQISYGAGQGGTAVHNVQIGTITIPTNGTLSIPHSFCPGIDAQVQPFTNLGAVVPYIPAIRAISDSAILVNFINPTTDALRTDASPSTRMSMHVTKNFSEGIRVDGTQGSYELDLQEGNIWFYGIMLV